MTDRAERLLARAWRRAKGRTVSTEGFLEDALAAALEAPTIWPALVAYLGWASRGLPAASPRVRTQRAGDFGRTDIELDWPGQDVATLVMELKVQAPPSVEQVAAYIGRDDDVRLAGIAAWSNEAELRAALPADQAARLLGVVTWTRLRAFAPADPPLILRQLHHLIDALEVAMPRIERQELASLVGSLPAWRACDAWIPLALAAVRADCRAAGLPVAAVGGPEFDGGWYAGWLDLTFAAGATGRLWVGLILEPDDFPPLDPGLPDLALHLEVDARLPFWQVLAEDAILDARLREWGAVAPAAEARSYSRQPGEWAVLTTRAPGGALLAQADQRAWLVAWMQAALVDWVAHGILARIVEVAGAAAAAPTGIHQPAK
jgi:hypothetical protein